MDNFLKRISKKTVIKRGDDVPYMIRYTIFNWGFLSLKIHHVLLNDDHCMHDHPWKFVSLILKGGYFEHTPKYPFNQLTQPYYNNDVNVKFYRPFSLLIRPANFVHRLELPEGKTAWTMVFTFKKFQDWGFYTKNGWVTWSLYREQEHCN